MAPALYTIPTTEGDNEVIRSGGHTNDTYPVPRLYFHFHGYDGYGEWPAGEGEPWRAGRYVSFLAGYGLGRCQEFINASDFGVLGNETTPLSATLVEPTGAGGGSGASGAERFDDEEEYWDDAHAAILDSVQAWGFPAADIPRDNTESTERRIRHKVLCLYFGSTFHDDIDTTERSSLLHPRTDRTTRRVASPATTDSTGIGFRYVMGERHGAGRGQRRGSTSTGHHRADRFSAIGIHAHEFGHLLRFRHPEGSWTGTNPYTQQTTDSRVTDPGVTLLGRTTAFSGARTLAWSIMQSDADGPAVEGSGGLCERLDGRRREDLGASQTSNSTPITSSPEVTHEGAPTTRIPLLAR